MLLGNSHNFRITSYNVCYTKLLRKADYKVEIQVSNPNPFVTDLIHKVIEPGQTWNADFTLPGMGATNSAIV